jgi:hypothetical protein
MKSVLDQAIRELREETAAQADGELTRQRIEAGWLHRKARARSIRRLTTVATVALLMGGGAWAATVWVQQRSVRLVNAGAAPLEQSPRAGRSGARTLSTSSASPVLPASLPSAPSTPPPRSSSVPSATGAPAIKRSARAGGRSTPVSEAPSARAEADLAQPPSDATTASYAAAHQAHFVDRDWPRALDLWSRYLALAPTGPLAPEAHFNRAVCLLRLDRSQDAARELAPFAAGQWGGYRQSEAAQLLAAMPKP